MTWEQFTERAVLTPFLDKGRSYLGFDCWGLVVCGYRDVLGVSLPSYDEYDTVRNHKVLVAAVHKQDFRMAQGSRRH